MNFDNDDALDRALFALPLEEPPADFRAGILSATIYRPAPVFSFRELVTLSAICAVLVWLVAAVILTLAVKPQPPASAKLVANPLQGK